MTGWPAHVRPGAVRFGRASSNYDSTIAFYRELVGLPVIDAFAASFGEDGTIFGLPDTTVQLEIIRAREAAAVATFDIIALYLDDAAAVTRATAPLRAAGLVPRPDQHPYWAARGAVTYRDPDGRDVVFAPWVYGRDPEPIDQPENTGSEPPVQIEPPARIEWFDGDRDVLRPLFREAEDSEQQLNAYLGAGRVLVAQRGSDIVGHVQLVPAGEGAVELKNMAVVASWRGTGIGRALVEAALAAAANEGARRMVVATGSADVSVLRFYQRCGFRFLAVDRDAFTPETGYPERILIDGIELRDRIWLDQPITGGSGR